MEALIIGLSAAFNFLIIKTKLEKKRYQDAAFDVTSLILLSAMFGGTMGGMIIATVGSAVISLYLFISPPKFLATVDSSGFWQEFKSKLPKQ